MRHIRASFATCFAAVMMLVVAGCNQGKKELSYPRKVICTTAQVGDILRNIGGKHVEVTVMITGDPHDHSVSVEERRNLNAADIVFYNGLHLEAKIQHMLEDLNKTTPSFAVTADLEEKGDERLRKVEGDAFDPHVWFDATIWSDCADYACRKLIEIDPKHKQDYETNLKNYKEKLAELHTWCKDQLAEIPKENRVLVTAHDAFRYFGKAYEVDVRAIQGVSTTDEVDSNQIKKLAKEMSEKNIGAVFYEAKVTPVFVESLIKQADSEHKFAITKGDPLYSDSMGEPGKPEGTYDGMMRYNVTAILKALK